MPLSHHHKHQRRFAPISGNFEPKRVETFTEIRRQALISLMERELSRTERQEIYNAFVEHEHWLIGFRLEYELQRREWMIDFFGTDNFCAWPNVAAERHAPIIGRSCEVRGVPGHVGVRGLFVPEILAGKERFEGRDVSRAAILEALGEDDEEAGG